MRWNNGDESLCIKWGVQKEKVIRKRVYIYYHWDYESNDKISCFIHYLGGWIIKSVPTYITVYFCLKNKSFIYIIVVIFFYIILCLPIKIISNLIN